MASALTCLEKHYKVGEVAKMWGWSEARVFEAFRREPGVLCSPTRINWRDSVTIPLSVLWRYWDDASERRLRAEPPPAPYVVKPEDEPQQVLWTSEDSVRPQVPFKTYFIHNKRSRVIKIGKSSDVNKRMTTLQTSTAAPLTLLLALDSDCETHLHRTYKDLWVHGEWFKATPELLSAIEEMRKTGTPIPPLAQSHA